MDAIKELAEAVKVAVVAWFKQPGVYVALSIGFAAGIFLCGIGNA
jgi:hypothetical protein